jgi:hypothetical protein
MTRASQHDDGSKRPHFVRAFVVLVLALTPLISTCAAAMLSTNQLYGSWRVTEVVCEGCSGPVLSLKNKIIQIEHGGIVNPAGDACQAPTGLQFIKEIASTELLAGLGITWPRVVHDAVAAHPTVFYGFISCGGLNYMQVALVSSDTAFYFVEGQAILALTRLKIPIPIVLQVEPTQGQVAGVERQAGVWSDRPSTDTTPISFDVGGIRYTAPRNYIVWMDNWRGGPQHLVGFRVTFPGFESFTEKTRDCMTAPPARRPIGCVPVEFFLRNARGELTDDQKFDNARKLFRSQVPLEGPAGFELYETGPIDARTNTYRKVTPEHTLMIYCFLHSSDGLRRSVCNSDSLLPNGNSLEYHLNGDQLRVAEQIDTGIRKLAHSFAHVP